MSFIRHCKPKALFEQDSVNNYLISIVVVCKYLKLFKELLNRPIYPLNTVAWSRFCAKQTFCGSPKIL